MNLKIFPEKLIPKSTYWISHLVLSKCLSSALSTMDNSTGALTCHLLNHCLGCICAKLFLKWLKTSVFIFPCPSSNIILQKFPETIKSLKFIITACPWVLVVQFSDILSSQYQIVCLAVFYIIFRSPLIVFPKKFLSQVSWSSLAPTRFLKQIWIRVAFSCKHS